MKRFGLCYLYIGIFAAVTSSCGRSSEVWSGDWKLDESRSSISGASLSITVSPTGEYYVRQGSLSYGFRCDGRDYPMAASRTTSCRQLGTSAFETKTKKDGKAKGITHWELSGDGTVLRITLTPIGTQGTTKPQHRVYTRASGSGGFSGTWNDARPFESEPSRLELSLTAGFLHYAFPEIDQYADVRLDGSEAEVHGPGVHRTCGCPSSNSAPASFLRPRSLMVRSSA